ncbi:MAG TPA: VWA domain-containing protein [Planctomycetes bacterium]|nr:VWA domain-containing protein [Planctomycetota bacterium]HIK62236.1 VWA domain-containing protein [Planctomycetota bacterium]
MRHLLSIICLGLAVSSPLFATQRGATPGQEAKRDLTSLVSEVKEKEDKVDRRIFSQISSLGTEESFRALSGLINTLRTEYVLGSAYGAFLAYNGHRTLEGKSIKFLHLHAQKHRRPANKRAAVRALVRFGDKAAKELESLFRTQLKREEEVAVIAFQTLIPMLGERGGAKEAGMILAHGNLRTSGQEKTIQTALSKCTGTSCTKILCDRLTDDATPQLWKQMLLRLISERTEPAVEKALIMALKDSSAAIRTDAIRVIGRRGDKSHLSKLEQHLNAIDAGELRAAVVALCRLNRADPRWMLKLLEMAASSRPEERMGAAVGFLEIRTPEAITVLHELLSDKSWRVRFEAMQQVRTLRQSSSLPLLIERLDLETRRLQDDLSRVLRLMTGLDNGTTTARWRMWWEDQDSDYALPPYEAALAAEMAREERKEASVTQVTFYGLGILSDRLAFIVDTSGSMSAMANRRDGDTEGGGRATRLTIAKEEISRVLEGLSPGVLFNLVFFSSGVSAWQDELIPMDAAALEEALEFTNRHGAGGGTNVFGALMAAFDDPDVDTLYLLSDGDPSVGELVDTAQIHDRVLRMNETRKVRIHCISIGKSSPFMKGLAEASGGTYVEFL